MLRNCPYLVLVALLSACQVPDGPRDLPTSQTETSTALVLQGQILAAERTVSALITDIANGATVSLIDGITGTTVSTAVSTPQGIFSLYLGNGFVPVAGRPYHLEALKGLAAGGNANRAGSSVARLRTVLFYQGGRWVSLGSTVPGQSITIGWASTAVALIASLRSLSSVDQESLAGKIRSNGQTFDPTGTPVSLDEFTAVYGLVEQALANDQDPFEVIAYDPTASTKYGRNPGALVLHGSFTPSTVPALGTVTFQGQNLPAPRPDVSVTIGGMPVQSWQVNAPRTQLTATLAPGAYSGLIQITQGNSTWTGPFVPVGASTPQFTLDYENGNVTGWANNTTQSGGLGTVVNAAGGPTGRYMSNSVDGIIANYPSTTAYGVWEFDIIRKGYHEFWPIQNNTSTWMSSGEGYLLWYYYDGLLRFSKVTGGATTHLAQTRSFIPDGAWVHYRIERSAGGKWRVYENDALVIQAIDNTLTTSASIGTYYWTVPANQGGLDTIKVSSW